MTAPVTTGLTYDAAGSPTWAIATGGSVSRADDVLTITRPGREDVRGRMAAGETHRHAYDRLLELDRLQHAAPVVYDDWTAAVCVEADVAGQPVTVCVTAQLAHAEPRVLYATGAEVLGAGEGALSVGNVVPVSEAMIADVEAVLMDVWADVEAA